MPQERRPVEAEDVFRFRLVSDPQLSPDGTRVVFVLQRTDRQQNRYFSNLWIVPADGSAEARPFTQGDQCDRSPRWSPDGSTVAFVSDRGECAQLWRIRADGGEAEKLTSLEEGSIGELHWSPSGSRIAFTYRPKPPWARKAAKEEREKEHRSMPPLVVRRLAYREEGAGYLGDERRHVHLLELESREVRQLTQGDTEQDSLAWDPSGEALFFLTNRSEDPDRTPQYREIRRVRLDGQEEPVAAPQGQKNALAVSPDGRHTAYYGHTDVSDVWSPADSHLWIVPLNGSEPWDACAAVDRSCGDATLADLRAFGGGWTGPVWSPDSRSVRFLLSDRGSCHVYRLELDTRRVDCLTPRFAGEVASLSFDAAGETVAAVLGDPVNPGDVHVARTGGDALEWRRLTDVNRDLLDELELARPEEMSAASDGGEVHGWLMRPPGLPAGERAPLILYIHGGPHTQYGWSMMHEFQLLAARGFAVLYSNPRGSRGYGQAHVAAIRGDWGGADYRDLMAAVEHAVTLPGIDPDRLAVTGGSYGGYMTNWIVGHTDRFRCAVTQRSVVNLHSMGGTCDFNFSDTRYFGGNTWSDPQRLLGQSPLSYAGSIRTPLLILHSEGDLRCPIEQAEQLFAALKCQGREVEFIRYPREANHGLSRSGPPDLRQDRLERIAGWMDRWLAPGK